MLIFVIPAIYPYKDNKQLGIYIYEQCEALKKFENKIVVLNASTRNYKKWNLCNKINIYSDSVGEVYTNLSMGIMQAKLPHIGVFLYKKNLKKIFHMAVEKYGKPDILYAHFSFPSGYCAYWLSQKYNIPYAVEEHYSLYFQERINPYIVRLTKKTIENASDFFCVSNKLKENLYRHTGLKSEIEIIPNLINNRYDYKPLIPKDRFVFFSAGNLYKSKKFDLLIDAFSHTFTDENVELRIAGAGKEYEFLKMRIESYNKKDQIHLLGRLDREQMLKEYEMCDCFVLLSEYETFGIVYREALAVGRPIISSRNGGIEENWDDNFGLLIKDNTVETAGEALKFLYNNYDKYDCKKISQLCKKLYSESVIAKKIDDKLKNIVVDEVENGCKRKK